MPTPILNIPEISPTQTDKTTTMNDMVLAVENATQNQMAVSFAGGNVSLSNAQFVGYTGFICGGATAARDLIVPLTKRNFFVDNTAGGYPITTKGASGATVVVPAGQFMQILCNGTDCKTTTIASASGTVTQVTAGAGLSGGPVTTTGTLAADWHAGTVSALGANLTLTSGTLAATGGGGSSIWNAGTVTALGTDVSASGGTLTVAQHWNGGTVSALGANLTLTSGTLAATGGGGSSDWNAGTVTALGANLSLTSGTLSASGGGGSSDWNAGTVTAVSDLLTVSGGTLDVVTAMRSVPLPFSFSGKPAGGQMVHVALLNDVPLNIPASLAGTATYVGSAPYATADFVLAKVNSGTVTTIGTISIAASGSITLTGSAYTGGSGDTLRLTAPSPPDTTLSDVCITIEAKRP